MLEPVNKRARWRYVLDLAADKQPGDVLTHEQIIEAIPDHPRKSVAGQAVNAANAHLLEEHQRILVSVRGVGYRVATAAEHYDVAQSKRLRAKRQARRAKNVASNFRRDEVTPELAARLDVFAARMSELERRLTRQERKTEELTKQFELTVRRSTRDQASVDARLERLEALLGAQEKSA